MPDAIIDLAVIYGKDDVRYSKTEITIQENVTRETLELCLEQTFTDGAAQWAGAVLNVNQARVLRNVINDFLSDKLGD